LQDEEAKHADLVHQCESTEKIIAETGKEFVWRRRQERRSSSSSRQ
jgi:hypothetical protein